MMENDDFIQTLLTRQNIAPVSRFTTLDVKLIISSVCAYLNGDGGWIVVGVDDNNNAVTIPEIDSINLSSEIAHAISPLPLVYVQHLEWQTKPILLVTVMKGRLMPYTFEGKFYVIGNKGMAVVPNKDDMGVFLRQTSVTASWETIPTAAAEEDDIDYKRLQQIYEIGVRSQLVKPRIYDGRALLSECGLLDYGVVRNGAVALFAYTPVRFMRQCRCRVQVMLNGKSADKYDDVRIFDSNIFDMLEQLRDYFERQFPNVVHFNENDWTRTHDMPIPMEVLDEAVVNALVHRDMGDLSGEVVINIYRDKMEISNSGDIPRGILIGKNRIQPHISELRNPIMAEFLHIAGLMEKTGRGMMLIFERLKQGGFRLPEWRTGNGYTTLTIYSTKAEHCLSDRAVAFLQHGCVEFNRIQYMQFFDNAISDKTAKNDIAMMVEGGWVKMMGAGPTTKYSLTGKELPDFTR